MRRQSMTEPMCRRDAVKMPANRFFRILVNEPILLHRATFTAERRSTLWSGTISHYQAPKFSGICTATTSPVAVATPLAKTVDSMTT